MPDKPSAARLAEHLVQKKLAACVNILSACESVYMWQGKLEHAQEIPMLIKTNQTQYAALETAIINEHPYELPEIIVLNIDGGSAAYLQWLDTQILDAKLEDKHV